MVTTPKTQVSIWKTTVSLRIQCTNIVICKWQMTNNVIHLTCSGFYIKGNLFKRSLIQSSRITCGMSDCRAKLKGRGFISVLQLLVLWLQKTQHKTPLLYKDIQTMNLLILIAFNTHTSTHFNIYASLFGLW